MSSVPLRELVEIHGREHLEAALAAGKGAILCTGHFGSYNRVHDYRQRDDMPLAYLSDSVNVTSIYETYPSSWFSIKQRLADHGFGTKIVNVATLMLMHSDLDVRRLPGRLQAPVFGFHLHWLTQCNGAIELAALLKEVQPDPTARNSAAAASRPATRPPANSASVHPFFRS